MSNTNDKKIEIRDLRSGDWLWTHKAVLFSPYVGASDFKVYCGLASFAGNHDQKSWPSLTTLASKLNLGKSTVIRSLKVLESCKLIQIDRRDGTSNLYSLLQCEEVKAPAAPKKSQSPHHRLIQFFHEQTQAHRGVTLKWSGRDTVHLKRALQTGILTEDQLEQLMLYFLAAPQFKRFTPSMATFFSAGIFNGLQNTMKNNPDFFKELYAYEVRSGRKEEDSRPTSSGDIPMTSMQEMVRQLSEKLSTNN